MCNVCSVKVLQEKQQREIVNERKLKRRELIFKYFSEKETNAGQMSSLK